MAMKKFVRYVGVEESLGFSSEVTFKICEKSHIHREGNQNSETESLEFFLMTLE